MYRNLSLRDFVSLLSLDKMLADCVYGIEWM